MLSATIMFLRLILLGLVALTIACAPAIRVHTVQSPSAHFDRYGTFAFQTEPRAPASFATSPQSGYVERRVEQLAADVLRGKGYAAAEGPPADLMIHVSAGRREREIRLPQPSRPDWLLEDEEDDFVEGAFVIDAFDTRTGEMVWHGSGRLEIDPRSVQEERLQRAVRDVLASFPPR
jgi:hypothetical protein